MMSLWDALRMNMMISYQELVRTFPKYEADLTTTSGENLTMTVGYTYGNASSKEPGWRTISVKEGGIITDIRKQGQWLPNGYK
ncbi:hypothetical protein QT342_15390 [Escherichia coli]|uniref:hypothetical protein n=2 Tax=Escherichia coli TaxID=562 RepID=UPI000BB891EF|nr:hypothetical protein [Escherichia coli]MDM4887840.1 hypothetical protein [Escherichia coli]